MSSKQCSNRMFFLGCPFLNVIKVHGKLTELKEVVFFSLVNFRIINYSRLYARYTSLYLFGHQVHTSKFSTILGTCDYYTKMQIQWLKILILKSLILGSYLTFVLNMILNGSLKFQICGNTLLIIFWNKGYTLTWVEECIIVVPETIEWDKTLTKMICNNVKLIGVFKQRAIIEEREYLLLSMKI